jgi:NADH-quinone oxidoreductase subunit M
MVFTQPILLIVVLLSLGLIVLVALDEETHALVAHLVAQVSSIAAYAIGLLSILAFDKSNLGFQFLYRIDIAAQYNLSFTLGADGISMVFLLLTLFIFPLLFLSAWTIKKAPKEFITYLLLMELLLVLTFTSLDLFYFYVCFESLLIPMFIMIGV